MSHGLWYAAESESQVERIARSIERDDQFSTVVITDDIHPKEAELAIISLQNHNADYLASCQRGQKSATGKTTIVFSNHVALGGITSDDILQKLSKRFWHLFSPPAAGPWRVSPGLWQEILRIVLDTRPGVRPEAERLRSIVEKAKRPRFRMEGGLEVFERDAVATAIQVWGGPALRKRILRSATPARATAEATFLSQLSHVSIREDLQINNDWITFPGLEVIQNSVVGSVVLGDEDTDEYLTILNCNRQPLEETLGVDLVYYNHLHGSFVLVQYKRMTSEGNGKSVYRPDGDKNLQDEIRRMKDAMHAMERLEKEPIVDIFGYRLNDHPFYLKLCDSKVSVALDANMVAGMYLPLALWDLQMEWPHSRGPRGGRAFTFDNCIRRFNNGEFTSLLRRGWIGSAAECSEYLSTIIEQVLGSGRMLVLAATSPGEAARDYRRDGLGRFAAEDDPTGAM